MNLGALRGWWGGRNERSAAMLTAMVEADDGQSTPLPAIDTQTHGPDAPASAWTPLRLDIAESLWGAGSHVPGYADDVLRVATPFGMRDGAGLLLIGAGGGGAALRVSQRLGVRVYAREPDPVLGAACAQRLRQAGKDVAKRINLAAWDPKTPSARQTGTHFAVAFEALDGDAMEATLASLAGSVRRGGHLAVLQTVVTDALDPADRNLLAWCRLERRAPPSLSEPVLLHRLQGLGFDVRTAEDWSHRQIDQAMAGWNKLLSVLNDTRPSPARAAALVAEAELWLRRIHLLRDGQLRYLRLHAISGDADPGA